MSEKTAGERNREVYEAIKAALPPELHDTLDELCEELESDFTDAKKEHVEEIDGFEWDNERMAGALESVKYWFLDVMVHKQPMTDPRKILRVVEEAL